MITALALLTVTAPPAPPQPVQGLISASDYPRTALARGEQGAVYFELVIDPEGRVDSCAILLSSGYKDLDDVTCHIVTTRARFSPARNNADTPIYANYRQVINWRIDSPGPPPIVPPDLDLTINQAPQGVNLPLQFAVRYVVQPNGAASHCEFSNDWAPRSPVVPPPALVDLACAEAMKGPIRIVRSKANEPVEALGGATVRFSLKP